MNSQVEMAPVAAAESPPALTITAPGESQLDGAAAITAAATDSNVSVLRRCYRPQELSAVVGALAGGSSLLIVGRGGLGLTTLARFAADDLRARGEAVAFAVPATVKQLLVDLCQQFGLQAGKATAPQLQAMLTEHCRAVRPVLIFDDAHRLPASFRDWLTQLVGEGQRLLLCAVTPPRRDLFLKLPRIELKPMHHAAIREILIEAGRDAGREFTPAQLSEMCERAGGNPMLARRAVTEELMGLEPTAADHEQWIDGTPMLIAAVMIFAALRYIGRGVGSSDLIMIGGLLSVSVGLFRLLLYSMPRKSNKLG